MAKKRMGIQLCVPLEERLVHKIIAEDGFCYVQPKLNGWRARLYHTTSMQPHDTPMGEWNLVSSTNDHFLSVPRVLQAIVDSPYVDILKDFHLDGELYVHGWPLEQIASVLAKENTLHPLHTQMEYHVFDTVDPGMSTRFRMRRLAVMETSFPSNIKLVPLHEARSMRQVNALYDEITSQGYEGIVVRKPSSTYYFGKRIQTLKFKPSQEDRYEIIGVEQAVSEDGVLLPYLGALVCKDLDGNVFNVGTGKGITMDDKEKLWERAYSLIGKDARIQYQAKTAKGIPGFAKFVEII